jgi:hypothetical protein
MALGIIIWMIAGELLVPGHGGHRADRRFRTATSLSHGNSAMQIEINRRD